MTNSESPGIIEGPREPISQFYIMLQNMHPASKTPQYAGGILNFSAASRIGGTV